MPISDRHRAFLIDQAKADRMNHSGRTLYAHLVGTHALLEAWGNPEPVCNAGLFHSIYGTRHFRQKAWPIADRATIQRVIGPDAERLAYLFCVVDRPRAFFDGTLLGRVLRPLREIEAANLLEQNSRSRWLKDLRGSDISAAARHSIARHLAEAA